jgi:WD repeat-containing protein 92
MDSTDAPQIIEHIHKQIAFTPYDNKWIPFSKRFVAMGIHPNAKGALQVTVTAR